MSLPKGPWTIDTEPGSPGREEILAPDGSLICRVFNVEDRLTLARAICALPALIEAARALDRIQFFGGDECTESEWCEAYAAAKLADSALKIVDGVE